MKKIILFIGFAFSILPFSLAQEYATFEITGTHQGIGSLNNAALSGFNWTVNGTLTGEVQILDNEVFDDGNAFENTFGQADNAQNLRIQVDMNGSGTQGQPLTSRATLTLIFDQITPSNDWGFCVVDIDVENCLIAAIDENDNQVPADIIDGWLIELFDANLSEDGTNLPKWDATHAALLGSDTPEDYIVYNNLVIGDMPSSEAPAAYFMPDIPLKSLTIVFENLQDIYNTSYHFYIASMQATAVEESNKVVIDIFPVPASEIIRVRMHNRSLENSVVTILNVDGKEMLSRQLSETVTETQFDVSHLPAGVYFLRFFSDHLLFTKKICITGR